MEDRQTFYKIHSEQSFPEWEARCYAIRALAPKGPSSRVSTTLVSRQARELSTTHVALTPDEAREYARHLIEAAAEAEEFDKERDTQRPPPFGKGPKR